jgi:phosphatidylglycerophosphate synthase
MGSPKPDSSYKVEDRELLMGFYRKLMWDGLVERVPESVTPNSITIMGQVCAVLGVGLAGIATLGYPILYGISALAWLAYLTADNIDGAHARRTGQTSILGEFLDHGLDGMANGCLLITAALVLHIEGIWMALFLAVGALGFVVTFWEQYRTRRLVIPELSSAEGVTVVMTIEVLAFAFHEPSWLHLDLSAMNFSMGLMIFVLFCYAVAIVQPVWRAKKAGAHPLELIQVLVLLAGVVFLVSAGAPALAPSVVLGLLGADIVCRLIRLRHRGEQRGLLAGYHWFFVAPSILCGLFPYAWTPEGWAIVAVCIAVIAYTRTLVISALTLIALDVQGLDEQTAQ